MHAHISEPGMGRYLPGCGGKARRVSPKGNFRRAPRALPWDEGGRGALLDQWEPRLGKLWIESNLPVLRNMLCFFSCSSMYYSSTA